MRSDVFIRKKQKFIYDNIPPPYFYCLFDFIGPRLLHIIIYISNILCSVSYVPRHILIVVLFSNHGSRLSAVSAPFSRSFFSHSFLVLVSEFFILYRRFERSICIAKYITQHWFVSKYKTVCFTLFVVRLFLSPLTLSMCIQMCTDFTVIHTRTTVGFKGSRKFIIIQTGAQGIYSDTPKAVWLIVNLQFKALTAL